MIVNGQLLDSSSLNSLNEAGYFLGVRRGIWEVVLPLDSHDLHKLDERKNRPDFFVTLRANLGGVDVENIIDLCFYLCMNIHIYLFIYVFMYLFIYLFIYSFIHLYVYLHTRGKKGEQQAKET